MNKIVEKTKIATQRVVVGNGYSRMQFKFENPGAKFYLTTSGKDIKCSRKPITGVKPVTVGATGMYNYLPLWSVLKQPCTCEIYGVEDGYIIHPTDFEGANRKVGVTGKVSARSTMSINASSLRHIKTKGRYLAATMHFDKKCYIEIFAVDTPDKYKSLAEVNTFFGGNYKYLQNIKEVPAVSYMVKAENNQMRLPKAFYTLAGLKGGEILKSHFEGHKLIVEAPYKECALTGKTISRYKDNMYELEVSDKTKAGVEEIRNLTSKANGNTFSEKLTEVKKEKEIELKELKDLISSLKALDEKIKNI